MRSAFERLLDGARGACVVEKVRLLEQALGLWRGSPLVDVRYEEFAQGEIRRLEELRVDALEELLAAKLELGAGAALVPELQRLVGGFPLRERLRMQLMVALHRSGRSVEALASYVDWRRTLMDAWGIEPGLCDPAALGRHPSPGARARGRPLAASRGEGRELPLAAGHTVVEVVLHGMTEMLGLICRRLSISFERWGRSSDGRVPRLHRGGAGSTPAVSTHHSPLWGRRMSSAIAPTRVPGSCLGENPKRRGKTMVRVPRAPFQASVVSTASTRPLYGRGAGSTPAGGSFVRP